MTFAIFYIRLSLRGTLSVLSGFTFASRTVSFADISFMQTIHTYCIFYSLIVEIEILTGADIYFWVDFG